MAENILDVVEQEDTVDRQNKANFFIYIPCTHLQQGDCNPTSCVSCDIYKGDMKERYFGGNPADN